MNNSYYLSKKKLKIIKKKMAIQQQEAIIAMMKLHFHEQLKIEIIKLEALRKPYMIIKKGYISSQKKKRFLYTSADDLPE